MPGHIGSIQLASASSDSFVKLQRKLAVQGYMHMLTCRSARLELRVTKQWVAVVSSDLYIHEARSLLMLTFVLTGLPVLC